MTQVEKDKTFIFMYLNLIALIGGAILFGAGPASAAPRRGVAPLSSRFRVVSAAPPLPDRLRHEATRALD
ncbi:MAG: hypothetical protein ACE5IK_05595, partial [Acidobacteriota bacterium]